MSFRSDISAFALHRIRDFVHRTAGIVIGPDKTALVTGRLWRRLAICGVPSYDAYVDFIARPEGAQERSVMLDLLATNETNFFRNLLIYFDSPTKQRVVANVLRALRPGGWLILGHCESLQGLQVPVDTLRPSIYRKPAMGGCVLTRIAS